jgi:hypothetical protein
MILIGIFFFLISPKILIPLTLQLLAVFHQIIWFPLFIIWLIVFGRTWPPEKDQCISMFLCCCVKSNISDHPSDKQSKRLITYKLFILFILSTMMTSLVFVIRSRFDLNQSERIIAICIVSFAGKRFRLIEVYGRIILGIFEVLLLMPPHLFLNFIKIQIFVINILMCKFTQFSPL